MVEEPKAAQGAIWQTYTNKDYLNRIYIDKYEATIEFLMNAIVDNPDAREERKFTQEMREKIFKKSLASLYWSLIVPRIPLFEKEDKDLDKIRIKYKDIFLNDSKTKKTNFEQLSMERAAYLLTGIGEYLYSMGVTRPERQEKDLDHIGMEERDVYQ